MSTVAGKINVDAGGAFTATFVVNTITHKYEGTFTPTPGPFFSDTARLEFGVTNDLANPRTLSGWVGPAQFQLNFENGPIIKGPIATPLAGKTVVAGTGSWSS